jgi:hypothetical protein
MTNNWRRTIGIYVEALETGDRRARDAAAMELMIIADHLNKLGVKYPDMVRETPSKIIYPTEWR